MTQSEMGRLAFVKHWIGRHPYLGALLFLVYWLGLLLGLGRLLSLAITIPHIHLSFLQANLFGELLLALIVVLPLALLGWWSETGFTRGINGRGVAICLIPAVLIVGPTLFGLPLIVGKASESVLVIAIVLALLVGFAEEGMFRGLIIRSLLPKGIWPTVLLSALLFTSAHLTNLIHGTSGGYVSGQLILAFGSGVLFAALRLRTGSIWPSILLHAGHDAAGLILAGINPSILLVSVSNTTLIVNGIFCLFFLLNAFILLRPSQVRKLRIAYGLEPEPVVSPYGTVPPLPYPAYGTQQPPSAPGNDEQHS